MRNKRHRATIRMIILEAKDRPCAECGVRYPVHVMDFDHRTGTRKRFNGRDALTRCSIEALQQEIEKCDVVCANCHLNRTYRARVELGRQDSNLD